MDFLRRFFGGGRQQGPTTFAQPGVQAPGVSGASQPAGQGRWSRFMNYVGENPEIPIAVAGGVVNYLGQRQAGKVADRQQRLSEEESTYQRQEDERIRKAREIAFGRILARRQGA